MRLAVGTLGVVLVVVGACQLLWPERLAVNVPIGSMLFGSGGKAPAQELIRGRMRVPEGFTVGIYAEGIKNARLLRFTATGDLLVSQPRQSRVLLLERDADGDGRADGRRSLLEDLNRPHGMDFRDGWLYVAETDAVGRIRFDAQTREARGEFERVVTGIPGGSNHWTRSVRFGPDGWMYVSVGSSCNVCIEEDERRAAILRYRPDGSGEEIYARGLRNPVSFDWQPGTGDLYATDNGRDLLGNDVPPCELNRVVQGGDYGWPYAYGDRIPDPSYGAGEEARVAASIPPAFPFRAHNSPLGIAFVRSTDVPADYRGAALVALHGSWNRTRKDGYKVVSLHWDENGEITERDFLSGFLLDEDVIGRPVDVAEGPDGAFYISDDHAGVIWRVAYGGAPADAARFALPAREEIGDDLAALSRQERIERSARGEELYRRAACATCHEPERAEAGAVIVPLEDLALRYDVAGLDAFLVAPTPPMPAFPFDREERRDIAVYLLQTR